VCGLTLLTAVKEVSPVLTQGAKLPVSKPPLTTMQAGGVPVAVGVAVGVGVGVRVEDAVAVGDGVGLAVGVGLGVPTPIGAWIAAVIGEPVLK
jgi:hypothetical protein